MSADTSSKLFVLSMDVAVGVVGFFIALGWWKISGRTVDRASTILIAKIFGGIIIFGMIMVFLV